MTESVVTDTVHAIFAVLCIMSLTAIGMTIKIQNIYQNHLLSLLTFITIIVVMMKFLGRIFSTGRWPSTSQTR